MKIVSVLTLHHIYVSENGRETPLTDMHPKHLLNAYLKAEQEGQEAVSGILRDELLRRLTSSSQQ
jgi:hypothetical protein